MTHSGGKPHTNVGDRGQRYEVSFKNGEGARQVMGWANHLEGVTSMVNSISLHPTWCEAQIVDRHNNTVVALGDVQRSDGP